VSLTNGEVFFEVQKDAGRPFVIATARGRIMAVGTAFTVDVMPGRLNVTVSEGTVSIEAGGEATSQKAPISSVAVLVAAGLRYESASNGARISPLPPAGARATWRDGRRAYYDEPLSAVIADLNRYSADLIQLTDPALKDLQYTGTVFPDDLGDWLMSLPEAFPVRVQRGDHVWSIGRNRSAPKTSGVTTP
jgi:transmembrane sensor